MSDTGGTKKFTAVNADYTSNKIQLMLIYNALKEKGYTPIDQIVGFLLTDDPAYITNYKNAREMMTNIDRYDLLVEMLSEYLKN